MHPLPTAQFDILRINGQRIETCRWVPAEARPESAATLVFLHEGLGCVRQWRDFPAQIVAASGIAGFAYSRAGYGGSDPAPLPRPSRYMHDEALITLPALLEKAGIRQPILIGHSDGASIALIHAGGHRPASLSAVVALAPHLFVEALSLDGIRQARSAYTTGDLRDRLAFYHGQNVDNAFWGWNDVWLDPAFAAWNIESYVADIQVPVLSIQGSDDRYGTRRQVDVLHARCPTAEKPLLLDDCGHSPYRDQPAQTLALITAFSGRLSSSQTTR